LRVNSLGGTICFNRRVRRGGLRKWGTDGKPAGGRTFELSRGSAY
jgi:hypothetical protein